METLEGIHPKAIIIVIGDNNSIDGEPAQEIADGAMPIDGTRNK